MKKAYIPIIMSCMLFLTLANARAQDSLTVNFMNMTPHVGQNLYLRVVDTLDTTEVARTTMMVETADFDVKVGGLVTGQSYNVDFWADHNMNGMYDPPGTDHAWRIVLDSVRGDTIITFTHNTDFTDILWPEEDSLADGLTIAFSQMTPHVGQILYLRLLYSSGMEIEQKQYAVDEAAFDIRFDSIMVDSSYVVDFWADHNMNGSYDVPPTDHAWRLTVDSVMGDTIIPFVHNTDFTDINWPQDTVQLTGLTIAFSQMTPHLGQGNGRF